MAMKDEIKEIIVKNNLVPLEHVDALVDDMYHWYKENRRDMKPKEFNSLLKKYL